MRKKCIEKQRAWLELSEPGSNTRRVAARSRLGASSRIGCAAAVSVLAGGAYAIARANYSTATATNLSDLLPTDLDELKDEKVMRALAVQLLLFGGFHPTGSGSWQRGAHPPASLADRVDAIAPTWKPGGRLNYEWPAEGSLQYDRPLTLFAWQPGDPVYPPRTVRATASNLEAIGLRPSDFDAPARAALGEMMTWRNPQPAVELERDASELTLLVLSFDATPQCRSLSDCPQPGPSNELLAATAEAFVRRQQNTLGQSVNVIAQWEVAAALHARGMAEAHAVGSPGVFENTAQIFEHMVAKMSVNETSVNACSAATDRSAGAQLASEGGVTAGSASRVVLLAHPDHLPRALRIGETTFASLPRTGPCHGLRLVPALQPYRLDWPSSTAAEHDATEGTHSDADGLNLYTGVSGTVHTGGELRQATWYDDHQGASHGYFPDGEPQRWVHRREIFVCYELWARAKGVATGVIKVGGSR